MNIIQYLFPWLFRERKPKRKKVKGGLVPKGCEKDFFTVPELDADGNFVKNIHFYMDKRPTSMPDFDMPPPPPPPPNRVDERPVFLPDYFKY